MFRASRRPVRNALPSETVTGFFSIFCTAASKRTEDRMQVRMIITADIPK
jgi:hypothetical protein